MTYLPANKDGTLLQQAQYWLEKATAFEVQGQQTQCEMAFKMALKKEAEHHGTTAQLYDPRRA